MTRVSSKPAPDSNLKIDTLATAVIALLADY